MIAKRSVRFVSDDASRLQLAIKRNSGGKTVSVTKANQRQRCASYRFSITYCSCCLGNLNEFMTTKEALPFGK